MATKREFNTHFLATLEQATRGGLVQPEDHIDEIFPPHIFTYGQDVIDQMNAKDINDDVEAALNQFA